MRRVCSKTTMLVCFAMTGLLLSGCQTTPKWDWWRMGNRNAADSTAVARSAGVELPSIAAKRAEGNVAPAFVPKVPEIKTEPVMVATAPAVNGYASTGFPDASLPVTPAPTVLAADAGSGTASGGIAPQQGPYDAGPSAPVYVPPTVPQTDVNSYASTNVQAPNTSGGRYGTVANNNTAIAAPAPVQLAPANVQTSPYANTSVNVTTPEVKLPLVAKIPPMPKTPPTANIAIPGNIASAATAGVNSLRNIASSNVGPAPPTVQVPPVQQASIARAASPYRPGGTSDYPGAVAAAYSVATRPAAPVVNSTPTVPAPTANTGRYSVAPVPAPMVPEPPTNYR